MNQRLPLLLLIGIVFAKCFVTLLLRYRTVLHGVGEDLERGAHQYSYLGADYPLAWPIPSASMVRMFIEDTVRYQMDNEDSEAEWEALVPNDGIVYLGPDRRPFSISMFHQLRCLNIVRRELVEAHRPHAPEQNVNSGPRAPSDLSRHCINYLRQMILCQSDLRLDTLLGKPKVQAFPDIYECKDWEAVYREASANHAGTSGTGGATGIF